MHVHKYIVQNSTSTLGMYSILDVGLTCNFDVADEYFARRSLLQVESTLLQCGYCSCLISNEFG